MRSEVTNNAPNVEKARFSGLALIFGRNDPASSCHHLLASQVNLGQNEEHFPLNLVLGNPTIAGFSMAQEILDDMKWMFHTSPDAGLQSLRILGQSFDFALGKLLHLTERAGNLPIDVLVFIFSTLRNPYIARIRKDNLVIRTEQPLTYA